MCHGEPQDTACQKSDTSRTGAAFLGGFWPHSERLFIVPFKSFRFVTHNAFERQWHEHQNHQHYLHSHTEQGLWTTEYGAPTGERRKGKGAQCPEQGTGFRSEWVSMKRGALKRPQSNYKMEQVLGSNRDDSFSRAKLW